VTVRRAWGLGALLVAVTACSSGHSSAALAQAKGGCRTAIEITGVPAGTSDYSVSASLTRAASLDHRFDGLLATWNRYRSVSEREREGKLKIPSPLPKASAMAFFDACDRLLGRQPAG